MLEPQRKLVKLAKKFTFDLHNFEGGNREEKQIENLLTDFSHLLQR